MPSRGELEDIARRWIECGWQRGNADAVLAMYAPDFVDVSNPYAERGTGEDNVRGIRELYAAFPDFFAQIEDIIVDTGSGKLAVRWSANGTHRGEFFGVAPTGRCVTFYGIETLRVVDGLIVERAGEWDGIEILRQIDGRS
ncbi:MAG: ester cyclase [Thermomicrobiales bacterium]